MYYAAEPRVPSGVALGDFVAGHTTSSILDAATANDASSGGVSVLSNGTPPTDGQDGFTCKKVPLSSVPGGQGETAIVSADLDGNWELPIIIAADPGNHSIDIWLNPSAGAVGRFRSYCLDRGHPRSPWPWTSSGATV